MEKLITVENYSDGREITVLINKRCLRNIIGGSFSSSKDAMKNGYITTFEDEHFEQLKKYEHIVDNKPTQKQLDYIAKLLIAFESINGTTYYEYFGTSPIPETKKQASIIIDSIKTNI